MNNILVSFLKNLSAIFMLMLFSASASFAYNDTPKNGISDIVAPTFENSEQIDIAEDRNNRMTVNVDIPSEIDIRASDKGPYRFIIDTAAQRTVLSSELARTLDLETEDALNITTLSGTSQVKTFYVPELKLGKQNYFGLVTPTFKRSSLGADGILGLDSLQDQRILFDFKADEILVQDKPIVYDRSNIREIVVRAKRRDGQLIFTNAMISDVRVNVIIDTGSEVSIGNEALRKRLKIRSIDLVTTNLIDVKGIKVPTEITLVRDFKMNRVRFDTLPMAFADIETFKVLKLEKRPALFLGMDALRKFDRIAIDFADRRIYFLVPEKD